MWHSLLLGDSRRLTQVAICSTMNAVDVVNAQSNCILVIDNRWALKLGLKSQNGYTGGILINATNGCVTKCNACAKLALSYSLYNYKNITTAHNDVMR